MFKSCDDWFEVPCVVSKIITILFYLFELNYISNLLQHQIFLTLYTLILCIVCSFYNNVNFALNDEINEGMLE